MDEDLTKFSRLLLLCCFLLLHEGFGCEWDQNQELRQFIRVPETAPVGYLVLPINVTQPQQLRLNNPNEQGGGLFRVSWSGGYGRLLVARSLKLPQDPTASQVNKVDVTCGQSQISMQVTVYVEDVNDHAPVFQQTNVTINVDELTPVGIVILGEIRVSDSDKADTANSDVHMDIESGNEDGFFQLGDRKRGTIKLAKPLDYDQDPTRFVLAVVAKDMGSPSLSSTMTVTVNVLDADDLDPVFEQARYTSRLPEIPGPDTGSPVRLAVTTTPSHILARDGDKGIDARLLYSLVDSPSARYFMIEPSSGGLYLTKHLDREKLTDTVLTLHIRAEQIDNPQRVGSAVVEVQVVDVNDNLPEFQHDIYAISIVENLPAGFSVVQVVAKDPDENINGMFTYHIESGDGSLAVNPLSGWLTVANHSHLDRETSPKINLSVCANQIAPIVAIPQYEDSNDITNTQTTLELETDVTTITEPNPTEDPRDFTSLRNLPKVVTVPLLRRVLGTTTRPLEIQKRLTTLSNRRLGEARRRVQFKLGNQTIQTIKDENGAITTVLPPNIKRFLVTKRRRINRAAQSYEYQTTASPRYVRSHNDKKSSLKTPGIAKACARIELTLLDANDNNPRFLPSNQYQFTVTEEAKPGDVIGSVIANDIDTGGNGRVSFVLQPKSNGLPMDSVIVDPVTGTLRVTASLEPGQMTVFVEAHDNPSNPSETRTSLAVVTITVATVHTEEPSFVGSPFEFWVGGDSPVGTSVGQVKVSDLQGPEVLFDLFHSYREGVPFAIEETSGIVSVVSPLARFSRPHYNFEAVVSDGQASLATNLTVHVATAPRPTGARDTTINFTVQENLSGGQVGDVMAALRALGVRLPSDPRLQLVSPEARKFFALAQDATLYTVAPLDFESKSNHTLVVVSARTSDIFYVHVKVEDVNDNPPQLNAVNYSGSIRENSVKGATVRLQPYVKVTDSDSYPGSSYQLRLSGETAHLFKIASPNGEITFVGETLDREEISSYALIVEAVDDGNLTSSANLTINVEDINDNPPLFTEKDSLFSSRTITPGHQSRKLANSSEMHFLAELERSLIRISETLPIGSQVTEVKASDADDNKFSEISYRVESQKSFKFPKGGDSPPILEIARSFSIEPKSGIVAVSAKLDPEHFYLLNISATDGGGLSSFTTISIAVFDVNDHSPKFELPVYNFEMVEGEYLVGEVGKVAATDEDFGDNGKISYKITYYRNSTEGEILPFRIVETTGILLATGTVDREEHESYEFSVVATDAGSPEVLSSEVKVHIDIMDINDHKPVFYNYDHLIPPSRSDDNSSLINYTPLYTALIPENTLPGSVVTHITANDSDSSTSGNGIILFKLEGGNDKFAIDGKNGTVFTVGELDFEKVSIHNLTVVVQDLGSPVLSSSAALIITVLDVVEDPTTRLFEKEEYQVNILENNEIPLLLFDLNATTPFTQRHYELVDHFMSDIISVDPLSGKVYLTTSIDRETTESFRFKVQAVSGERSRALTRPAQPFEEYNTTTGQTIETPLLLTTDLDSDVETFSPQSIEFGSDSNQLANLVFKVKPIIHGNSVKIHTLEDAPDPGLWSNTLGLDEVWIRVQVQDVNDNSPSFATNGRPIVGAIPASAEYGHQVMKIQASDPDKGIGGELRYEMLASGSSLDAARRFTIDPITGQVVVVSPLQDEAGRMFGFDVRATDTAGAPQGRSTIVNVFIYVLTAGGHLVVEVGAPPREVEPHLNHIQRMLTQVSGMDVRVQRIVPHVDGDVANSAATDVYVYGVDPATQAVVNAEQLRALLGGQKGQLRALLPPGLTLMGIRAPHAQQGQILQTAELAILGGAVVVFMATIIAIVCLCYKQRKR